MDIPKRRRKKKKTPNRKQLLIAGCVIGAVALIVAACIFLGMGGKDEDGPIAYDPDRGPLKELTVGELTRQGEMMVGQTSYLNFEFPYAFSDLIGVDAINQGNQTALAFFARIDGKERPLYTIWFNGNEGEGAGTLDLRDGEKPVLVTVVFYKPGTELSEDAQTTYYATQETVNDVLASMQKDNNFVTIE